jgi:hypothetical protein
MTFKQAKTALRKLINSQEYKDLSAKEKQQEIFKISKKVNADRDGTKTVLYSGSINGKSAWDIAKEMAKDPNARIVDKTDVGKFLGSKPFKDAIYATVDVDYDTYVKNELSPEKREIAENLNNQLIYNGKDGFWAEASKRFVSSAKDETLLLIGEPRRGKLDKDTVFYQVEFEEVVKNKNITTINGIDKSKYLDLLNFNQEEGLLTSDQLKAVKAITKATENETINFKKLNSMSDIELDKDIRDKIREEYRDRLELRTQNAMEQLRLIAKNNINNNNLNLKNSTIKTKPRTVGVKPDRNSINEINTNIQKNINQNNLKIENNTSDNNTNIQSNMNNNSNMQNNKNKENTNIQTNTNNIETQIKTIDTKPNKESKTSTVRKRR